MTIDYEIQGYYPPYGWEMVDTVSTKAEAQVALAVYDQNEPNVRHRIKRVAS